MQKKQQVIAKHWSILSILTLLSLSLQSCIPESNPFHNPGFPLAAPNLGINPATQAKFEGKIYFTHDRNLYVMLGDGTISQLTKDIDVRDPAISPDGKWIAFIRRFKNYSDLVYRSTDPNQAEIHTIVTGKGEYLANGNGENTFYWFAQPSWSADGKTILFLSDLHKDFYWQHVGQFFAQAPFLDLQAFTLPFSSQTLTAREALYQVQHIAYAHFGDGGLRDPSFRPNNPDEVLYTNYRYDGSGTKQVVQLMLINTQMMSEEVRLYRNYQPGNDPSVPLTPDQADLVNFQPSFSPDGKHIAYIRREATAHTSLYIMEVANGVTYNGDGYTFDPRNADNQAQALAPYHRSSKLLMQDAISQPVWSPDGKHLLYYSLTNNSYDLWIAELEQDKNGTYRFKEGSQVQITQTNSHLNADSRAVWI